MGLIQIIVDFFLGIFIHISALKMRNSKEYKDTTAKIKELDNLHKKLQSKSEKLGDDLEKAEVEYYKNFKNIKTFKPTKSIK